MRHVLSAPSGAGGVEQQTRRWSRVSEILAGLVASGRIAFINRLLVPGFDVEGEGLDLLEVNGIHPTVAVVDLNGDGRLDLVVSAREVRLKCSLYWFLIFVNDGTRLGLALRKQTGIVNGLDLPGPGYRLTPAADGRTNLFHTWDSEIVDFYDARTWRTTELVYRLDGSGRYQLTRD